MGPAIFCPQPPRLENNDSQLEAKNDASVVPEVTLVVIPARKGVAKPSQHEIKLHRSDGNGFVQGDVESSANHEIPRIIAWSLCGHAGGLTSLEQILVGV